MSQAESRLGRGPILLTREITGKEAFLFRGLPEDLLEEDVLSIRGEGFNWETFCQKASQVWSEYIPQPGFLDASRPSPEESGRLAWSSLVPEELRPERRLIEKAWDTWEAFKNGQTTLGPYVVVVGTMGTGKTELAKALRGSLRQKVIFFREEWEDNPDLYLFYRWLEDYNKPKARQSRHFDVVEKGLHAAQGTVQGEFASNKFIQGLMSMIILKDFAVAQDVGLGQDGVYNKTQAELGLASPENNLSYEKDNQLRQRLLPPYLKAPAVVFPYVPFEIVRERVLTVRGRDFETAIPPGYLEALHVNTIQWVLAMAQVGVPVIAVDAKIDFRPGGEDRVPAAALVWDQIERAKQSFWGR